MPSLPISRLRSNDRRWFDEVSLPRFTHVIAAGTKYIGRLAILSLLAGAAGCGTFGDAFSKNFSAWEGHQLSELIDSWGQPTSIEPLGLEYEANSWMDAATGCQRTFTSSKGIVISYSENGC